MNKIIFYAALSALSLAIIAGLFLYFFRRPEDSKRLEISMDEGPQITASAKDEKEERFDPSSVETGPAIVSESAVETAPKEEVVSPPKPEYKPQNTEVVDTPQGGEISVYFKPDGEAPRPSNSVTEMMNVEEKAAADEIISQLCLGGGGGKLYFSYHQPYIPEKLHLSTQLEIFDKSSNTLFRYISDAGWLADPSKYNPLERDILVSLDGVESLEEKLIIITIKVGDSSLTGEMAMYQIMRDYDGSEAVWAVHVSDDASGAKTFSEIVNMDYSFFAEN